MIVDVNLTLNLLFTALYANAIAKRVKINDDLNRIYLPKIGWVKCKGFRSDLFGKIKTVTVSFEANQYHASVLLEDFQEEILGNNNGKALGIDVGVKLVVAYSNGNKVHPIKLAKINLKIVNKRKNFLYKLSK